MEEAVTLTGVVAETKTHGRGITPMYRLYKLDPEKFKVMQYVAKGRVFGLIPPGKWRTGIKFTDDPKKAHLFELPVIWCRENGFKFKFFESE